MPQPQGERPLLPLLLDTTYFPPFAALVVSSPCGSRGLPLALTTYHAQHLQACLPPLATWPGPYEPSLARTPPRPPAATVPTPFLSQNQLEEHLVDYVSSFLSPALRGVTVGDWGCARASFFRYH